MAYKKPQDPLTNNGFGIYPLTTADQVILSDGSRLEKNGIVSANVATAANSEKLSGKSLAEIMLELYPVGTVYISVNSTSPASLFGGTWEQIKGRFLLACGDNGDGWNYSPGSIGGEAAHALTVNEMPAHRHSLGQTGNHSSFSVTWGNRHANVEVPSAIAVTHTPGEALAGNSLVVFQSEDHVTATSGGGAAHNNLPPYMAVYMWKRVK